jgi:glycosyltransferase involved in cell wall biosynthesis
VRDVVRVCIVLHTDLFDPWPVLRPMREARLLQELGREVLVFSWIKDPSSALPERETREGLEIRRVKIPPPKSPLARAIRYRSIMRHFAADIVALKPDAIICHDLEMLAAAVRAGRALRVPVLYHAHEDWPAMVSERSRLEGLAFARLERRLVRGVDHVYTVGEALASKYRTWGKPVTVQYGSKALADMARVASETVPRRRAARGFGADDFVVGIAGSLGRDEALPDIFEALTSLPSSVKLHLVGGLPARVEAARAMAKRLGLQGRVSFTGPLREMEYLQETALLDTGLAIFYPTSANQRFVVPLKLFDYMGLGIPAIVSDFPEMRRIAVEMCRFGVAIPPKDPQALRSAISSLAIDAPRRESMRKAARACFEHTFAWERQREMLEASHPIFRSDGR